MAQIFLNFTNDDLRNYVGWAPARSAILGTDNAARDVTLSNGSSSVGQVVFQRTPADPPSDTLQIRVPPGGNGPDSILEFFVAGKVDLDTGQSFPSTNDEDASIVVTDDATGNTVLTQPLMVRVRKNANDLTPAERDRFLTALVTLNQRGDFVDFQNMHMVDTNLEIHGRSVFLPWHRLYLLDLERKLQRIDGSVALPYWRFDQAAPNVFTEDFMGVPDGSGLVQFSSSNPLVNWRLTVFGEGSGRVRREPRPGFDPTIRGALIENDQLATINLGLDFVDFERMEGDPHGRAHSSFDGQIADIGRAPADPLFFMLHANVDRLWAMWQWLRGRFDANLSQTYYKRGLGPTNPDPRRATADRIGNYLEDVLWPWAGFVGDPRPRTAPGGYFPRSPIAAPGRRPELRSAIDYQGQIDLSASLGFSYDDIPFEF